MSNKKIKIGDPITKNKIINELIKENKELSILIHENYSYTLAEIIYAIVYEMAMTVEDILARRNRLLFLDAKASIEAAPIVAKTMAKYLNKDANWIENQIKLYEQISSSYLTSNINE